MRFVVAMAAAFLLAAVMGLSGSGAAHAEFVSSSPSPDDVLSRPPTEVRVTVSESVQAGSASIFVSNATGSRFDVGPTSLNVSDLPTFSVELSPLGPAIYTVTWRAISADDGHLTVGSFYFGLTNPDGSLPGPLPGVGTTAETGPVSQVEIAFRFLAFFGLAGALGAIAFAAVIWAPVLSPSGKALPPERSRAFEAGLRALASWGRLGTLLFTAGIVGWWAAAASTQDFSSILVSPFQVSLASRVILGLLLAVSLSVFLSRSRSSIFLSAWRSMLTAASALGIAAVAAGSMGTHASAIVAWRPVGALADAIHVLGASLWVGGLLAFVRVRSWLHSEAVRPYADKLIQRFARFAFLSVGLILLGGVMLSLILVGSWEAFVGTGYGVVILAKASLFVPMIALGAYNRYRLRASLQGPGPASEALGHAEQLPIAPRTGDDRAGGHSVLERNVRVEAVLGGIVLLLAGILATLSPATAPSGAVPPSGIFTREATNGSLLVEFSVFPYPTVLGRYVFDIQVWYAANRTEYIRPQNGTANISLVGGGQSPEAVPFIWSGVNHFFVDTTAMDRPGTWRIDLPLITPNGSVAQFTFYIPLRA